MMDISNLKSGEIIEVWAKPNSSKSNIEWDNENKRFNVFLHSIPDDGKANQELIKLFKKKFKLKVEIIKGLKSRNKLIKIL
jgi:uncharacterized protein (TIGR00251 family)